MQHIKTQKTAKISPIYLRDTANLDDGKSTTVHSVRYPKSYYSPKIVEFKEETLLLDWCLKHEVSDAITGGFFLRDLNLILGDLWIDGQQRNSVAIDEPWNKTRGCIYIDRDYGLHIGGRNEYPSTPANLMQAGPVLLKNGRIQVEMKDPEGMSSASRQFDTDITIGRYPRTAIALNDTYIWTVACDGRSNKDAGMTLMELAQYLKNLGAEDALNLDGGGSSTLISNGKIKNTPRGDGMEYSRGRPIFSAITLIKQE